MKINNKSQGFTLIELILYVGAIALAMVAVLLSYNSFQRTAKVNLLSEHLKTLSANISNAFSTVLNPADLNNTFAVAANLVPEPLTVRNNATFIGNTFGGDIVLSSTADTYNITLNNIPNNVCGLLISSSFFQNVENIAINGTTVKTAGIFTPAQRASAATRCAASPNSTIIARIAMLDRFGGNNVGQDTDRPKEDPRYIATVGNISASGTTACAGGSAWNGSFCSCANGTAWTGSACVAYGSISEPGLCPLGQGWAPNTKICQALPNGSSSQKYEAGRAVPANISTAVVQTEQRTPPVAAAGNDIIAGKTITWQAGQLDDLTVQTCVNGSWNTAARRCVTP